MAGLDDLSRSEISQIRRLLRELSMAAPLQNASIGAGGLRVYDGGVITIENGGLRVTGTAEVIGQLIASGVVDFTGDVTISGPLDVTGLMTLVGDLVVASGGKITAGSIELNPDGSAKFGSMTISPVGKITSGSAEINPDGSVKFGQLTIDTAGKVTAGGVTIDPSYLGGSVKFSNGTYVAATPNGAQLAKGTGGAVTVSDSQADLGVPGGGSAIAKSTEMRLQFGTRTFVLNSSGTFFAGLPTTTNPGNLYISPTTGQAFRSTV